MNANLKETRLEDHQLRRIFGIHFYICFLGLFIPDASFSDSRSFALIRG
jgi:hypothetical protein